MDKRAARLFLYKHALNSPRDGYAITLAGSSPESEVTLLKDYLHWPTNKTWFVDNSDEIEVTAALQRIKYLWPDVGTYPWDLQQLLTLSLPIGFINLDFMGHLNSFDVLPCLKLAIPKLLPGAVLGLTWERGRERRECPNSPGAKVLQAGSAFSDINDQRWAGVLSIVDKIAKGSLQFIGGVEYQNNHSPMAVSVFHKLPTLRYK